MQFLTFVFVFFHYFFITTVALFNSNQNNSHVTISLYQCDTNVTTITTPILLTTNATFQSCDLNCCQSNISNQTTYSQTCQVTAQSSTGDCLGRLCSSGSCDQSLSLMNLTSDRKIIDYVIFLNEIRSLIASVPWSSFANSTQTKWTSWKNVNDSFIHNTVLIVLLITNILLTLLALSVTMKSIKYAKIIAQRKLHRYTSL